MIGLYLKELFLLLTCNISSKRLWKRGRRCHLILCLAFKESHIKSETHVLLFPPMSRLCDKISFSTLKSLYLVHTFIIVSTCQPGTSYLTLSSFSWSIDLHVYIELFPSMSSFHDKISVSITIHTMLATFDPLIDHLVYRSACNNGNKGWGVFVSVITFKSYQP
jgi:hypothetical protein